MSSPLLFLDSGLVAVGSTNPVKVGAVKSVIGMVRPDAQILSFEVDSGVSSMPMNDRECITGARNRALGALSMVDADLGIGLEGGVNKQPEGLMLLGWVVAVHKDGRQGVGGGARLLLPEHIAQRIMNGEELGPVMDELLGQSNVKQRGGAVGALTNGIVLRKQTFEMAVAYALAPFISPGFYAGLGE
ncbi:MAG: inosine/xanthosine triphosphatase [Candidatus Promineifilaceae bacterium]|jgi:inosine/xanthosine triphosphatase